MKLYSISLVGKFLRKYCMDVMRFQLLVKSESFIRYLERKNTVE